MAWVEFYFFYNGLSKSCVFVTSGSFLPPFTREEKTSIWKDFFAAAGIEPRPPASQALLHGLSGSYVIGTKPRRFGNVVAVQDPGEKKFNSSLAGGRWREKIQKLTIMRLN